MKSMTSMQSSRLTLPFLAVLALAALPFALKTLAPGAAVFTSPLTPRALLWIGGLAKLLFLVVATGLAWRSSSLFERKTPAHTGWRLLYLGLLSTSVAQAILVVSQVSAAVPEFVASPADLFFLFSYPLFIAALFAFLRAYRESGYPLGTAAERRTTVLITTAVCTLLAVLVLKPLLGSALSPLDKTLDIAYTLFDFVLLIPTVLLLRITLRFPGGAVWRIWIALLGGFVFVCAGDILFAWFSGLSMSHLDPVVDLMYIVGYGCLALGAAYQRELLA
jgi:hypothetical protein